MSRLGHWAILAIVVASGAATGAEDRTGVNRSNDAKLTSDHGGFIFPGAKPGSVTAKRYPSIEQACVAPSSAARKIRCPGTFVAGTSPGGPQPSTEAGAVRPHLRLSLVLRRMENKVISGGGVKQGDILNPTYGYWTPSSSAATVSEPAVLPVGLPVPGPSEVWDNLDHANELFDAIIENGCSNATHFDVSMASSVGDLSGATFGQVSLDDETIGHGYFTFRYKIRATGIDGGVSDIIFSGEVPVVCTDQSSL